MPREMKDSGIEWIGEIPKEWGISKIKNISSEIGSGTTPLSNELEFYTDGVVNWIQSGDLYKKSRIYKVSTQISTFSLQKNKSLKIYKAPFIVIAMYGASVGNTAISTIDACSNQACCCVKNNEKTDLTFLYYWLEACKQSLLSKTSGGGQPNISQEKIKNEYVLILPLTEQQKIANFLDIKCSEIDQLHLDIEKQIEVLEAYKKSVITEAVTKGLDPDVEMKDSGIEWIGEIPKDWEVKKVKYVCKTRNEKYSSKKGTLDYFALENLVSWNMKFIATDNEYDINSSNLCFKGDVVFGKLRPYLAKTFLVDYDRCCSTEFAIFYDFEGVEKYYLYVFTTNGFVKTVDNSTAGVKMPRANIEFIKNLHIPIAPKNAQLKIANFLDTKCYEIDEVIMEKQKQLSILEDYKKALIYEYVTGKKEVPDNE